ncbi:hypothetical protein [Planococcus maritimus]|uniref:hypothetical protein n=1 Tax=Planococcus maritimus TaxID=192421 RepID=UPI000ACDE7F4|nr:hypothetical protein [Planococcus maritimus]
MAIIVGIGWLMLLCALIIFFAGGAISQRTKKGLTKNRKDPYDYLFNIYNE